MEKKIDFISTTLPEIYIENDVREQYKEEIERAELFVNKWKEQIEEEGLSFDKELITKFKNKDTAIYDLMEKAFNDYAKTLKFVPKIEQERIKQTFTDIADRLADANNSIYATLHPYSLDYDVKNGVFSFNSKQVKDHIETLGVRTFSDLERQYVNLLNTATKAMLDAANFEIEHNLESYALASTQIVPSGTMGEFTTLNKGLVHDAKIGVVNTGRIIKGIRRREV